MSSILIVEDEPRIVAFLTKVVPLKTAAAQPSSPGGALTPAGDSSPTRPPTAPKGVIHHEQHPHR